MHHTLLIQGFGIRLRPVRMDDAKFIVWLRNQDFVKGRVGDSANTIEAQERWLTAYFERSDDYYFCVETLSGIPVGTIGLYEVAGDSAELGRLIIRPRIPAALPATLLGYDLVHGTLGLAEARGTVVSTNTPMLRFIRQFGVRETKTVRASLSIAGSPVDIVHFRQSSEDWAKVRGKLLPLAHFAESKLLGATTAEMLPLIGEPRGSA